MDNNRQVTRDEFIAIRKVESLAQQNANQALRIAELEAQLSLLQIEINNLQQPQEAPPIPEIDGGDEEDAPIIQ